MWRISLQLGCGKTRLKIRIGKLYRKDVLEYFPADGDEGAEEEIITMPGKVKNVRTEYLLDADSEDVLRLAVGFIERCCLAQ